MMTMTIMIKSTDILCGKTSHCQNHPGSIRFRHLIEDYSASYEEAQNKYDKMTITKVICDRVSQQSCRFLKFNDTEETWEELSAIAARDKVGHALRFSVSQRGRKQRKQELRHKKTIGQHKKNLDIVELPTANFAWTSLAKHLEGAVEASTLLVQKEEEKWDGLSLLEDPTIGKLEFLSSRNDTTVQDLFSFLSSSTNTNVEDVQSCDPLLDLMEHFLIENSMEETTEVVEVANSPNYSSGELLTIEDGFDFPVGEWVDHVFD